MNGVETYCDYLSYKYHCYLTCATAQIATRLHELQD